MSDIASDHAGVPPVREWIATQTRGLLRQRGHAWLLQGPSGLGQYHLALSLVRAWLCETPGPDGACGLCRSCHAIDVRANADLFVLMPELQMLRLGWPLSEKAQGELDDKKRKPSKEIRVDAMRDAVEFTQRTNSQGRGKAILVYPAEQMNMVTANALLKTLEEPPGAVKFVLATESAHQLLPTIRSRCIGHTMQWPATGLALEWLQACGLRQADAVAALRSAGGRPDDALDMANSGRDPQLWAGLRAALNRGDSSLFKDWSAPQMIDALQKLCHDLMAHQAGADPRFFDDKDLGSPVPLASLSEWNKALMQSTKTMDHPFNAGLMQEALVNQAKIALNCEH